MAHPALKIGQILGGSFEVLAPLSAGAFGALYTGRQLTDGLDIVIKALRADANKADPKAAERFVREAAAASRLDHPNIIRTLNVGRTRDGVLYMVLERLHGRTLAEAMYEEPVDPEPVAEVLRQILRGLVYAHERGLVHRDLKPSNVFVCDPEHLSAYGLPEGNLVKLLDFGFVKVLDTSDPMLRKTLTLKGHIVGTPGYLAPEMLQGKPVTPRADLYAVGVIGYELLLARQAFPGSGFMRAAAQVKSDPEPPPEALAGLPIWRPVFRLMARNPDDRYGSAAEALEALEHL